MKKEIMGYVPLEIKKIDDFTIMRFTPYYREIVCSDNARYINKKTGKDFGSRLFLFIRQLDDEGNMLPENEWEYDNTDNIVLVDSRGVEHEIE